MLKSESYCYRICYFGNFFISIINSIFYFKKYVCLIDIKSFINSYSHRKIWGLQNNFILFYLFNN
jgi:hypothetical protein